MSYRFSHQIWDLKYEAEGITEYVADSFSHQIWDLKRDFYTCTFFV